MATIDFPYGYSLSGEGVQPSLAVWGNTVVEVHRSEEEKTLWYRVGTIDGKSISWADSHKYDTGEYPSIAFADDGTIVEVHETDDDGNLIRPERKTLWYRIGQLDGDEIVWGDSYEYDTGVRPSVGVWKNAVVVEVHQAPHRQDLWYRLGRIRGEKIAWQKRDGKESTKFDTGQWPRIAIRDDGWVVEVHTAHDKFSEGGEDLWYHLGKLSSIPLPNGARLDGVDWGDSHKYGKGRFSAVAVHPDTNDVVEIHKSQNEDQMWYWHGVLDTDDRIVRWRTNEKIGDGRNRPAVAMTSSGVIVEVNEVGKGVEGRLDFRMRCRVAEL